MPLIKIMANTVKEKSCLILCQIVNCELPPNLAQKVIITITETQKTLQKLDMDGVPGKSLSDEGLNQVKSKLFDLLA